MKARAYRRTLVGLGVLLATISPPLGAQGHGPVYGLSTPTLGRGGWSLDLGGMRRWFDGGRTTMLRPMLSHGVTEDVQLSLSIPVPLERDVLAPNVRAFTRMPAQRDVELMLGWRVQRRGIGVGRRQETTLWLAADLPTEGSRAGIRSAPGLFGGLVTGYASRSLYLWVGVAYRRPLAVGADQRREGDTTMGSLVVGYRPPPFRGDYPRPDWRLFVEVVGERIGGSPEYGTYRSQESRRQLYAALTVLGLYGSWGIAGGPAYPLYQSHGPDHPDDGVRLVANLTFWF